MNFLVRVSSVYLFVYFLFISFAYFKFQSVMLDPYEIATFMHQSC